MKSTPKKWNVQGQRNNFALGTQRNIYSSDSCWGFALGVTQILAFLAKLWHWGSKPTTGPNANGFALQWNIGLRGVTLYLAPVASWSVWTSSYILSFNLPTHNIDKTFTPIFADGLIKKLILFLYVTSQSQRKYDLIKTSQLEKGSLYYYKKHVFVHRYTCHYKLACFNWVKSYPKRRGI